VCRQGYFASGTRSPEKYLINDPDQLNRQIAESIGVKKFYTSMARLNFSGLLNNGRSDLPIIGEGVQPTKEAELGSSVVITAGRQLADSDDFGILLGQGVAKALKLFPGDHITLLANTLDGALNSLDFEVIGVFQSFSNDYDARAVKIPLPAAQELIGTPGVNALVILLQNTKDTDQVAEQLASQLDALGLEIKTWVELNDFYEKTVEMYKGQFGVLQIIILIMVLLSVANSLIISIFERFSELVTMMRLGNRSSQFFLFIIQENLLLRLIGSGLGSAMGLSRPMDISAIRIANPPPTYVDLGYNVRIHVMP